jgi:alpha-glucosidase
MKFRKSNSVFEHDSSRESASVSDNKDNWWKHAVVYQIYPRSFYDANGDGVGDIRGIIHKLDYIEWLGVDALWLSPINDSPMYDFGYDISDYRSIDAIFGTLADFDELIEKAHARNIRIIMDLVVNHTSYQHAWFQESRMSRRSPKRDWYIWRDSREGEAPNNWKSVFGGSAWKWDEMTHQFYLHSFLEEQPDLNWRNPDVKKAVFAEVSFWLDRGVDGFRLDVVNWFVKDSRFRNNPMLFGVPLFQRHLFDRNRPETHDLLKDLRSLLNRYADKMSVGEVFSLPPGDPVLSARFLGDGTDQLHLSFDFSLLYRPWNARMFYKCIKRWIAALPEKGWPCHVLSNHDQFRSMSRFGADSEKRAKVAAVLLLTLKGTPFVYYGEEIGMKNGSIPRHMICDPLGKKYWPFYAGRDRARTPMQWNSTQSAGFSAGRPWLPVHTDYMKTNVLEQMKDTSSLLYVYRNLIAIRKENTVLREGDMHFLLKGRHGVIAFMRELDKSCIFVVLNFLNKPRHVHVRGKKGQWKVLFSTHRSAREHFSRLDVKLYPYEATVLEKIGDL